LETLQRVDNLKQALLLRFLTPTGELALLGHPDYGSRLSELIGELNNETNRNRA
jgi:phage baseplate assembly protein W